MIIKNEIPLLEYDNLSAEVIPPNHDCPDLRLPAKCVFAFLGNTVDDYARAHNARIAESFVTISQIFNVYVLHYENEETSEEIGKEIGADTCEETGEKICKETGKEICEDACEDICLVQSPIGSAAAAQLLDTLVTCGCKKVIAVGSCGVLAELPENAFMIPTRALRDEGTSYKYLPASRYIDLDEKAVAAIAQNFDRKKIPYEKCTTWSTDGFFRETKDMVRYRLSEGCAVVEMECAALAACARKRGGKFGQFLFTADSLADVHEYDARGFGMDSHEKALRMALDVVAGWN